MSSYLSLHDRPPYFANLPTPPQSQLPRSPRYGTPDLDPDIPYHWIQASRTGMSDGGEYPTDEAVQGYEQSEAGPSRKRSRHDHEDGYGNGNGSGNGHGSGNSYHSDRGRQESHHYEQGYEIMPIIPSIFGIPPRNEFTKTIGEFIMNNARGRENVEIEIKLGTLMSSVPAGEMPRRVRMPTMSEMIMPPDYPIGGFVSNMNKNQNKSLNQLLNGAAQSAQSSPCPIKFYRAQHVDSFYSQGSNSQRGGGKVRVSRDRAGNIVENGVICKRRVGDLNVYSPREAFDWRVSVSTEQPCEIPTGAVTSVREKDRACYRHQLCQVDLTVVTTRQAEGQASGTTFELEIEVLDVPSLLAEGEKEERGEPNRFDEILQSCLDTARMLIRNVEG